MIQRQMHCYRVVLLPQECTHANPTGTCHKQGTLQFPAKPTRMLWCISVMSAPVLPSGAACPSQVQACVQSASQLRGRPVRAHRG